MAEQDHIGCWSSY